MEELTQPKNSFVWLKKLLLALIFAGALGGIALYYSTPKSPIQDFNDSHDTQHILDIFERDRWWLYETPGYSPEFMLKYRAPFQNIYSAGRLNIKVMYEGEEFVGFIAYYKAKPDEGLILFLDINPEFRGKKYSEKLLRYAIDDLHKQGILIVCLSTRVQNVWAQRLYERFGFKETSRGVGFVEYVYPKP